MSVQPEHKNKSKLLRYCIGWRKGAGGGAFSNEDHKDPDWRKGWTEGREAMMKGYRNACLHYDCELSHIRLEAK